MDLPLLFLCRTGRCFRPGTAQVEIGVKAGKRTPLELDDLSEGEQWHRVVPILASMSFCLAGCGADMFGWSRSAGQSLVPGWGSTELRALMSVPGICSSALTTISEGANHGCMSGRVVLIDST